jgi:hypothetical protein
MIPSLIRTYVPLLIAYVVGWLASLGITVDDETRSALTTLIGTVVAALYYAAARWAEQRWPWATVLLGSSQQPVAYTSDGSVPTVAVTPADPDQPAAGVPPAA